MLFNCKSKSVSKRLEILASFLLFHYLKCCSAQTGQSPANNEQPFASILYTAVVRGKVALPCDVTAPTSDDSVALVLWYKDDALAPIYTLDARKGTLEQARTLTSSSLNGRAYFNLHHRPAFLQIDPIRLTDAGDYRCRVDFKRARTVNTIISLKVIVPPEEPIISSTIGTDLKGLIGPFNEGDELKLVCVTVGGKPRPSLTWWRDENLIDDSFEYNDKDVTTNQLTIPSLARHYLLSIFTCQAVNNNVTLSASSSITLDLNIKPSKTQITQITSTLVAGKEAVFQCHTFGSRPKAILYWIFNGQRFNTPLSGDHQTSTSITLEMKQSYNKKFLSCVAENSKIPNSAVSDQIKLDVQFAPILSLKLGSPTILLQSIQEGNDIYFDCHIEANPRLNKPIVWKFNGNVLNSKQGIIQSNQTLVLQRVARNQSGGYECEASNEQGMTISNKINLTIRYAPVCKDNYIYVYAASLHETIYLQCDVDANPSRVSFQWKFESSSDLLTFNSFNDTSSLLAYAPHWPKEYGLINCIAKNDVGLQQQPCSFRITTSAPSHLPFKCKVVNQSDNALVVNCLPDIDLSDSLNDFEQFLSYKKAIYVHPSTSYNCEVYQNDAKHAIANVSQTIIVPYHAQAYDFHPPDVNNVHFFINNLQPATLYRLKCYSIHSKGQSEPFWLNAETTEPAQKLVDYSTSFISDIQSYLISHKSIFVTLLIAVAVILLLIAFGLINLLRSKKSSSNSCLDQGASYRLSQTQATVFNEEDAGCDELIITPNHALKEQLQHLSVGQLNKGPPDIIPSIGFSTASGLDKQYISYSKFNYE